MRKNGPVHVAEPGLTAGRQSGRQVADEIQVNLEILKSLYMERFDFLLRLTKLQHHYSSRAFHVFFRVKFIIKLFLQC